MSGDVDWSKPLKPPAGRSWEWVREEQLRRAELLLTAAGAKMPKAPAAQARRVAALAAIVPGLRYVKGRLTRFGLAPHALLMHSALAKPRPRPGRKPVGPTIANSLCLRWLRRSRPRVPSRSPISWR